MDCGTSFINKVSVAVLTGGPGHEREISLESGRCVIEAFEQAGCTRVQSVDIRPDNLNVLDEINADVFFIALHGTFGEDGQLQKVLEDKGLIYTGSGPEASWLAFDKMLSKEYFERVGVAVPASVSFDGDGDEAALAEKLKTMGGKFVVKPIRQGSSVGVRIVGNAAEAVEAAGECLEEFGNCMIEEFVAGREITVGVLDGQSLPIVEVRPQNGFYDYHSKYVDEQTEYLFGTIADDELVKEIEAAAISCFESLGCGNFARIDFILTDEDVLFVLEANTIPGFTTHSLLPKAAQKAGISMSDLCVRIARAALREDIKK